MKVFEEDRCGGSFFQGALEIVMGQASRGRTWEAGWALYNFVSGWPRTPSRLSHVRHVLKTPIDEARKPELALPDRAKKNVEDTGYRREERIFSRSILE